MGQAEEGSPPYELGRVTCIFILVPRVWDPCPGACPVVRVSGGSPPSPFSPPSLLPFPPALAHFHLGQVPLEGGGSQSSIQSDYFGASVGLSSLVPSGLVTWASV